MLVLLGGAMVKIVATDIYLRYVKPSHKWWLLAAGAVILALAAISIVRDMRAAHVGAPVEHGHDEHGHAEHGHAEHGHREPRSPWLLILPVLAILLVAPPALGADSVNRSVGGNTVASASTAAEFDPLPAGEAPEIGLTDFVARAVWDRTDTLIGRDVTLTGFVVHRGASVELARMVITCCAADARPMTVRLTGLEGYFPSDSWLRVRARLLPGSATVADGHTPSARVVDAEVVAAPADPYEF
jgi:uncharacterized repeat protein (TIGR03943 family)